MNEKTNYLNTVDGVPFRTIHKMSIFAWTAASAKLGQVVAKKIGCESRGQVAGAIIGATAYSAIQAKAEQYLGKNNFSNRDVAEWMDTQKEVEEI